MTEDKRIAIARWLGRLLALAGFLFVPMFAGEGVPSLRDQSLTVWIELAGIVLMVPGLLIGWKFERTAAAMIAGGWVIFLAAEGGWPPWPFTAFLTVAALYGYCGFRKEVCS